MNTNTYSDAVVVSVAHHFILHLLPSLKWLVDEELVGMGEGSGRQGEELLLVVGEARAQTSQSEGGPDQNRIPQSLCSSRSLKSQIYE